MIEALELPHDVQESGDAIEIARAWLIGEDITFITRGNIWEDPAAAGIFAADLVRHLIDASDLPESAKPYELRRAAEAFAIEFGASLVPEK